MPNADLRARVEAAALDALARVGPENLDRGAVVRSFAAEGLGVRTGYRWLADYMDSGRAGLALNRVVAEAAAARAARTPDPAAEVAQAVSDVLPKSVTPADIVGAGPIPVMEYLRSAIAAANDVMAYAKTPEGKVRNAKLLLSAADRLRQCLDTAMKISTLLHDLSQVEKFHAAIIQELRQESPALAERVLARLNRLTGEWSPPG